MNEINPSISGDQAHKAFRLALQSVSDFPTATDQEISDVAISGLESIPEPDRERVAITIAADVNGAGIAISLYSAIRTDADLHGGIPSRVDDTQSNNPIPLRSVCSGRGETGHKFRLVLTGVWGLAACLTIAFSIAVQSGGENGSSLVHGNGNSSALTDNLDGALPSDVVEILGPSAGGIQSESVNDFTRISLWITGSSLVLLTPMVILVFWKTLPRS